MKHELDRDRGGAREHAQRRTRCRSDAVANFLENGEADEGMASPATGAGRGLGRAAFDGAGLGLR